MAEKEQYYFNPETLSFEKGKTPLKKILKRLLWFFATALSFAVLVLWISFYLFDSPKEKMLMRENSELRQSLEMVNERLEVMDIVLEDVRQRDNEVYRVILESEPMPIEKRNYELSRRSKYTDLTREEAAALLQKTDDRLDEITLKLAHQSRSLDTVSKMAAMKAEMLASIPAIRPLKDMYRITSGFGRRYHPILKRLRPHTGIDIAAPRGTPVYATGDGVVSKETGGSGYGITVVIDHGYSYQSLYAHLSKKIVKPGQQIKRGQIIGYVGSTGLSMGTHLHYEVIKNGVYVNPVHYFFSDITAEEYEEILKSSKEINQALS